MKMRSECGTKVIQLTYAWKKRTRHTSYEEWRDWREVGITKPSTRKKKSWQNGKQGSRKF